MNQINDTASLALLSTEPGFDPIEDRLRSNVRATIEAVFEEELVSFSAAFATIGAKAAEKEGHSSVSVWIRGEVVTPPL
jgi:hypothetical protein